MKLEIQKRICICGKEYVKPSTCSKKDWSERYKFCSISCAKKGNTLRLGISHPAWNKGIPSPFVGELNNKWKGDEVSYSGIHHWVAKWKGKPSVCEMCGTKNLKKHNYHWANVDHKYRRVLDDYIRLCVQCHSNYDREHKLK